MAVAEKKCVSTPYSAVGTATPSYNFLFTFIPIALQLNTFPILLILDFTFGSILTSTVNFDYIFKAFHLLEPLFIQCNILPPAPSEHLIT